MPKALALTVHSICHCPQVKPAGLYAQHLSTTRASSNNDTFPKHIGTTLNVTAEHFLNPAGPLRLQESSRRLCLLGPTVEKLVSSNAGRSRRQHWTCPCEKPALSVAFPRTSALAWPEQLCCPWTIATVYCPRPNANRQHSILSADDVGWRPKTRTIQTTVRRIQRMYTHIIYIIYTIYLLIYS